jgi:hypothetical protein
MKHFWSTLLCVSLGFIFAVGVGKIFRVISNHHSGTTLTSLKGETGTGTLSMEPENYDERMTVVCDGNGIYGLAYDGKHMDGTSYETYEIAADIREMAIADLKKKWKANHSKWKSCDDMFEVSFPKSEYYRSALVKGGMEVVSSIGGVTIQLGSQVIDWSKENGGLAGGPKMVSELSFPADRTTFTWIEPEHGLGVNAKEYEWATIK